MSSFQPRPYKTINDSMLETISREWGLKGGVDSLDPFVQMLLKACADELSRIENKFQTSQSNVLNRLAELMMPDEWDIPKPAIGVLKVKIASYETSAKSTVRAENHFIGYCKLNEVSEEYFFSPTSIFDVLGAEVAFLANSSGFYKVSDISKKTLLSNKNQSVLPSHTIWLGVDYQNNLKDLKNLSFFFDWTVDEDKYRYYSFIKNSKWSINGIDISPKSTDSAFSESKSTNPILRHYEDSAQNFYKNAFINITDSFSLEDVKFETPHELVQFHDQIVNERTDNLVWIKVEFPKEMPYDAIKRLYCTTNAFPVLNRKLNDPLTYKLQGETTLIPLITKNTEDFFAVDKAEGDRGEILPFSIRRKGVERFDKRDANELLSYVTHILQDEIHAFKELNRDYSISNNIDNAKINFESIIKTLHENYENWENKVFVYVENKTKSSSTDAVDLTYWTTASFTQTPTSLSEVNADKTDGGIEPSCLLLTIKKGFNRPNENEKIANFREKLMSRGRIVTHQDIQLFCKSCLGDKLANVEIRKDVMIGQNSSMGFTRYINVKLIPTDEIPNKNEWEAICYEINNFLNEQMQVLPIKVEYQQ